MLSSNSSPKPALPLPVSPCPSPPSDNDLVDVLSFFILPSIVVIVFFLILCGPCLRKLCTGNIVDIDEDYDDDVDLDLELGITRGSHNRLPMLQSPRLPTVMKKLYWVDANKNKVCEEGGKELGDCAICLEDFEACPAVILDCLHMFHIECIFKWYQRDCQHRCPICRGNTQFLRPVTYDDSRKVV